MFIVFNGKVHENSLIIYIYKLCRISKPSTQHKMKPKKCNEREKKNRFDLTFVQLSFCSDELGFILWPRLPHRNNLMIYWQYTAHNWIASMNHPSLVIKIDINFQFFFVSSFFLLLYFINAIIIIYTNRISLEISN